MPVSRHRGCWPLPLRRNLYFWTSSTNQNQGLHHEPRSLARLPAPGPLRRNLYFFICFKLGIAWSHRASKFARNPKGLCLLGNDRLVEKGLGAARNKLCRLRVTAPLSRSADSACSLVSRDRLDRVCLPSGTADIVCEACNHQWLELESWTSPRTTNWRMVFRDGPRGWSEDAVRRGGLRRNEEGL